MNSAVLCWLGGPCEDSAAGMRRTCCLLLTGGCKRGRRRRGHPRRPPPTAPLPPAGCTAPGRAHAGNRIAVCFEYEYHDARWVEGYSIRTERVACRMKSGHVRSAGCLARVPAARAPAQRRPLAPTAPAPAPRSGQWWRAYGNEQVGGAGWWPPGAGQAALLRSPPAPPLFCSLAHALPTARPIAHSSTHTLLQQWEFAASGLMRKRVACINEAPIQPHERRIAVDDGSEPPPNRWLAEQGVGGPFPPPGGGAAATYPAAAS